jgi:hypothetical protein
MQCALLGTRILRHNHHQTKGQKLKMRKLYREEEVVGDKVLVHRKRRIHEELENNALLTTYHHTPIHNKC